MYSILVTLALAVVGSQAITVESPDRDTIWQSGTSAQTISWEAVSTDATSFAVQLVNQAGFLPNSPVTLIANQSTGASNQVNSITVTYPNGNWPVGTAFQINLVSSTTGNAAIYAQSNQFNITSSGSSSTTASSSSASSSGSPPSTISMSRMASTSTSSMSSGASAVSANAAGNSASAVGGGLPNAVTSTGSADAVFGTPSAFIGALMAGAALIGVTF